MSVARILFDGEMQDEFGKKLPGQHPLPREISLEVDTVARRHFAAGVVFLRTGKLEKLIEDFDLSAGRSSKG